MNIPTACSEIQDRLHVIRYSVKTTCKSIGNPNKQTNKILPNVSQMIYNINTQKTKKCEKHENSRRQKYFVKYVGRVDGRNPTNAKHAFGVDLDMY